MRLGQKSFKKKVHFSGDLNPPTFPFEITRPLRSHDCILGEVSGTLFTNQLFMLNGVETP